MKHRTRIAAAAVTGLVALTVGLTSATARVRTPSGPSVPAAAHAAQAQAAQKASPRPPARTEAVYTAIAPCRIADTRNAVGALHNGSVRTYYVGGTLGFAPQGGRSGGCGIPVGATAVSATLTAVSPSTAGYLRAWNSALAEPQATVLNYPAHAATGTGATLSLNPAAAQSLKVKNYGATTHLVIDVTGFYNPPIEGMVDGTGQAIYAGSSRLLSATRNATGIYTVKVDTDVSYCTPTATAYSGYVYASAYAFSGNNVTVYIWTLNPSTHAITPFDGFFYLTVAC